MRKCVPEQRIRDYSSKKYKIRVFKVEHKFNPQTPSWIFSKGVSLWFLVKISKFFKFVYYQIGPGNDVWWCSREVRRLSWPYLEMSNFGTHQLWLFGSFLTPFEHKNMQLFKNSTLQFFYPNKKLIQSNRRQYVNACLKKKIRDYS